VILSFNILGNLIRMLCSMPHKNIFQKTRFGIEYSYFTQENIQIYIIDITLNM